MMNRRPYDDTLTANLNRKGVLDIDTVKGCTVGMSKYPAGGCYGVCYAANIARFRGLDFAKSVARTVKTRSQARKIERSVLNAPDGFFRIGTMGDPCHAWEHTVRVVEWLAPFAVPVIVTKHWLKASDEQLRRLILCGAIIHTSVSALDNLAEIKYREKQIERYSALGGISIARIVSCDFNVHNDKGAILAAIQARLFNLVPFIDNPLRVPITHDLVQTGVVNTIRIQDLSSYRTVSMGASSYVGHCITCPDKCGLVYRAASHPKPLQPQLKLFQ